MCLIPNLPTAIVLVTIQHDITAYVLPRIVLFVVKYNL